MVGDNANLSHTLKCPCEEKFWTEEHITHPVRDFVRAVTHVRQNPHTRIVSLAVELAE